MITLTSSQRKELTSAAQPLSAVVIIGQNGVTDGVTQMVRTTLADHELIKVKFNAFKEDKQALSEQLAAAADAALVRIIGNTAIFYRPAEKPEDRRFFV
jgi:RNA-binding protein